MTALKRTAIMALAAATSWAASAPAASAATATSSLAVSTTVANNCTISTATVAFGTYDPIVANASSPLDVTGGVTITCTKGAVTTVGLNTGSNATGSTRRLISGSNYLTYELYQDSSRTTVWGNSGGDLFNSGTSTSGLSAHAVTIYALPYNLYSDAAHTTVWGDGTSGTFQYVNNPTTDKQIVNLTVYGRIPAGADVAAGSYADTITVTAIF